MLGIKTLKIHSYWLLLACALILCQCAEGIACHSENEEEKRAQSYLKAYPDQLTGIQDGMLIWKDGTRMPLSNGKQAADFQEALNNPDLLGQISIPYPIGHNYLSFTQQDNYDPGRIRYDPFFLKMYSSTPEEVKAHLVEVPWLPESFGSSAKKLYITQINGIDAKVRGISKALDALPSKFKQYLMNPGGSFNWRKIAGTERISAHSFGMTIDINVDSSHYWLWDFKREHAIESVSEKDIRSDQLPAYRNQIPLEIVDVFEQHHFIWGGKWRHYDTMHFEYRPELFQ